MPNEKDYKEIIVCLYDGTYEKGVAALANSLADAKFEGLIHVGYRGAIPKWTNQLQRLENNYFQLNPSIDICFKKISADFHLGYYKPFLIKESIDEFVTTNKFYFFDADIVVTTPWSVFSKWLEQGAVFCLDNSFHFIDSNHPWRKDWKKLDSSNGAHFNDTKFYFNSGFLGVERASAFVVDKWIFFTKRYFEFGGESSCFVKDPYSSFKGDQDLLNAAITTSPNIEMSIMGTEGMGFTLPASLMQHAIGDTKPWNKSFIKHVFYYGHKPNMAEKTYFHYAKHPIKIFSSLVFYLKKVDLKLASLFGRIIG